MRSKSHYYTFSMLKSSLRSFGQHINPYLEIQIRLSDQLKSPRPDTHMTLLELNLTAVRSLVYELLHFE